MPRGVIQPDAGASVVLILGRRGRGKTTFIIDEILPVVTRGGLPVIAWDWTGELVPFGREIAGRLPAGNLRPGLYVLTGMRDPESVFAWILDHAPAIVICDELDMFAPAGGQWRGVPSLRRILHLGRHVGVSLIASARRPANLHKDVLALTDVCVCFQVTEPNDLRYLARSFGDEFSARLPYLATGEKVVWPEFNERTREVHA